MDEPYMDHGPPPNIRMAMNEHADKERARKTELLMRVATAIAQGMWSNPELGWGLAQYEGDIQQKAVLAAKELIKRVEDNV